MFVVFQSESEGLIDLPGSSFHALEQAFAQVCCRAGVNYEFVPEESCWRLVLTDGERPECSPDPIVSTYVKKADAYRDLMMQAVDGRLRGFMAVSLREFEQFFASPQAAE